MNRLWHRFIPYGNDDLYFIEAECGAIKIGRSRNVSARFRDIQNMNPRPLSLRTVVKACGGFEAEMHNKFAKQRLRGEWFNPSPRLLRYIDLLHAASIDVPREALVEYDQLLRDPLLTQTRRHWGVAA